MIPYEEIYYVNCVIIVSEIERNKNSVIDRLNELPVNMIINWNVLSIFLYVTIYHIVILISLGFGKKNMSTPLWALGGRDHDLPQFSGSLWNKLFINWATVMLTDIQNDQYEQPEQLLLIVAEHHQILIDNQVFCFLLKL